jgi:hypothetical protein
MPPEATPIMIDGNRVASASAETRAVQLDQISINNMSRVEVSRSQNPDNAASGIGGTVNLIPKSAFERRNPTYTLKTYGVFRDHALKDGPYKIIPNYEVSAIVPLNARFGFAVNATSSETQSAQYASTPIWVPTASAILGQSSCDLADAALSCPIRVCRFTEGHHSSIGGVFGGLPRQHEWCPVCRAAVRFLQRILNSLPRDPSHHQPRSGRRLGTGFYAGRGGRGICAS